jgi:hypothetical protein
LPRFLKIKNIRGSLARRPRNVRTRPNKPSPEPLGTHRT